jgi:hypothetical protein
VDRRESLPLRIPDHGLTRELGKEAVFSSPVTIAINDAHGLHLRLRRIDVL